MTGGFTCCAAWVESGEWIPLAPEDRVCDQPTERFSVRLPPALPPGAHSLTVRAIDAADNPGLGQVAFPIGRAGK